FLFSLGSSSPALTGKSKFFARDYPSDATQGAVLADVAYNKKGWKKVAFIQEQLDYPLGIYNAFRTNFEKLGGTVIKEEFATGTTDFRSILIKLKAENSDAIFIDTQTPAAADRILRQMAELNWKPNILVSDSVTGDTETVKKNADILEGTLAAEFGIDENNPKFKNMVDAYKKKYGDLPYLSYAQTEYDGVYIIRDAIKSVGYDGEKIAEYVRNLKDWQGASGSVTIGQDGDRVGGHTPKVIINGTVIILK
ncbi:MAG: ABC transporter substrate-binding protein, partial [Candidatus Aenigmarchaeota archaeon]|nr:ABC transporter substrate-binding protein [Candidatus Aenigmarchaeota archaeon]MDI6722304.1 ABC transporter substrate-binding protein [Candidatus Aenigmarchaeota archaeon]